MRLALLGIGSLRCGAPVIASLATYFGEREIEVALFDADEERLDLFDRLAKVCFQVEDAKHLVEPFLDPKQALLNADLAIIMLGEDCASKYLLLRFGVLPRKLVATGDEPEQALDPNRDELVGLAMTEILVDLPDGAPLLSLVQGGADFRFSSARPLSISVEQWPPPIDPDELWRMPHQILRWVRGDDNIYTLLNAHRDSPVKKWLDDSTPNVPPES